MPWGILLLFYATVVGFAEAAGHRTQCIVLRQHDAILRTIATQLAIWSLTDLVEMRLHESKGDHIKREAITKRYSPAARAQKCAAWNVNVVCSADSIVQQCSSLV